MAKMGRPSTGRVRNTFFLMPEVKPFILANKETIEALARIWATHDKFFVEKGFQYFVDGFVEVENNDSVQSHE